jgi:isoleucyl-tRNA synthetase
MRGYHVHFMNGFSSYGTHVESAVDKESVIARRNACRDLVKTQTIEHMQSLEKWGILADYRYSYFTMQPSYEANVLERFADMQSRKLIERG